jgi:hypothetical protein
VALGSCLPRCWEGSRPRDQFAPLRLARLFYAVIECLVLAALGLPDIASPGAKSGVKYRAGGIRTHGLHVPNVALYQAEPQPVKKKRRLDRPNGEVNRRLKRLTTETQNSQRIRRIRKDL